MDHVLARAAAAAVLATRIGETGGDVLALHATPLAGIVVATSELARRRESCLDGIVGVA